MLVSIALARPRMLSLITRQRQNSRCACTPPHLNVDAAGVHAEQPGHGDEHDGGAGERAHPYVELFLSAGAHAGEQHDHPVRHRPVVAEEEGQEEAGKMHVGCDCARDKGLSPNGKKERGTNGILLILEDREAAVVTRRTTKKRPLTR